VETVVVTASRGAFSGLTEALREISVAVEERPLLTFTAPEDWVEVDSVLAGKSRYRALALTSPRAAQALLERIQAGRIAWNEGTSPDVWSVGAATTAALQGRFGLVREPAAQPGAESSPAGRLAGAMLDARTGGPVLFLCGEKHRDELPSLLQANGIEVDEVVCYRAVLATRSQAREALTGGSIVVVASPSVVELLVDACPPPARPRLVAIGPTTAASAQAAGWAPDAVASEPSTPALASAITGLLARH
jgi:uroporphyrinogen-III synthase